MGNVQKQDRSLSATIRDRLAGDDLSLQRPETRKPRPLAVVHGVSAPILSTAVQTARGLQTASLLYFLAAFYGGLTSLYFALGVYPRAALASKNALFKFPIPDDLSFRLLVGVGSALALATCLSVLRRSPNKGAASAASLTALVLFAATARAYQRLWLNGAIGALPALVAALPALWLLIATAIDAERFARMFSAAADWMDRGFRHLTERRILGQTIAVWVLSIAGLVTLAGFLYLTLNQYWRIAARYDTAHNENMFFHVLRGQIVWESLDRMNHLGRHFTPSLFMNIPIFAMFPEATTFLILESVYLVAAGIPLYFLARRITQSSVASFVFTLSYLWFPHTYGMNIHGFKELCMWPLLGFGYLLALELPDFHRRPWFWGLLLLSIGLKEEMALTVASFSVLHWLQGRNRRWNLVVAGICVIWFLGATQVVMPWLQGPGGDPEYGKGFLYAQNYSDVVPDGAQSLLAYGANALLHPSLVAQVLTRPPVLYFLVNISWPLLFLPWFSGLTLIVLIPNLLLTNLLASRSGLTSTLSSYIAYLVPWFYCGLYGWVEVRKRMAQRASMWKTGLLYALLLVTVLRLTQTVRIPPAVTPEERQLRTWLESRPTELRVMASRCFLPYLSGRDSIRTMNAQEDLSQLDLIIVQSAQTYCTWMTDPFREVRTTVLSTGDFVKDPSPQSGIVVYRRTSLAKGTDAMGTRRQSGG